MKKVLIALSTITFSFAHADQKANCFAKANDAVQFIYSLNAGAIQGGEPTVRENSFEEALQSSEEDPANQVTKHDLKLVIDDYNEDGESWAVNYYVNVNESASDCVVKRVTEGRTYSTTPVEE